MTTPAEIINDALSLLMNKYDLSPDDAKALLRRLSRQSRTQMCVVADDLVHHRQALPDQ